MLVCGGILCATGALASVSFPKVSLDNFKAEKQGTVILNAGSFDGIPVKKIVSQEAPLKVASEETIPACVKVENVVSEDFHLWVKGTNEIPDSERIEDTDEWLNTMMSHPGDWILFDVYQAGQAAYLGFDEVGDDGPGYISTPAMDLSGSNVAFRLRVKAMNVNENAQEQNLQNFFLDEANSTMVGASAQPLAYKEWKTLEWVQQTSTPLVRAMFFGWQGKVLVDEVSIDKLIYPLDTPKVNSIEMANSQAVKVSWTAVEGATSYQVSVVLDNETVGTATVGNVTEAVINAPIMSDVTYVAYVTAYNGDDCSYTGVKGDELTPGNIGVSVATEATNISEDGFTANWETTEGAAQYLVYPVVSHTSTENGETFMLLEDSFKNVPETNDNYNPAIVSPFLGMGNINRFMSCAGWSTDICFFFQLMPGMPGLVLMNTYAEMGLPGFIMSPVYDLSVGGGNVTVSGMGMSAEDDVVVTASLVDMTTGEEYSSADIDLSIFGDEFEVTIPDGRKNSCIKLVMTDYAGEDMVVFFSLNISVELNKGESITAALPTVITSGTSYDFDYPVDSDNSYSYSVQGFFGDVFGTTSNVVKVDNSTSKVSFAAASLAKVNVTEGGIEINNPENCKVNAYGIDGRQVISSTDSKIFLNDYKGLLIVKIGDKVFKVMR